MWTEGGNTMTVLDAIAALACVVLAVITITTLAAVLIRDERRR
jgi:hypothetical protein